MTNENVAATTTTTATQKNPKLVYPAVPRNVSSISSEYIFAYLNDRENNHYSTEQAVQLVALYKESADASKQEGSKNPTMKAINAMRRKFCEYFYPNLLAPKPKKQKQPTAFEKIELLVAELLAATA